MGKWNDRSTWGTGFPIDITRIAPSEDGAELEWADRSPSGGYRVVLHRFIRPGEQRVENLEKAAEATLAAEPVLSAELGENTSVCLKGLESGCNYLFSVHAEDGRRSRVRLFRTAYVPGGCICYLHPDDDTYGFSGRYPWSPSVVRLPD